MSVNSSSFDELSLLSPYPLSYNLSYNVFMCISFKSSIYSFSALYITSFLLLPLFVLVLYLGCQQWRQQRSTSMTATSHSNLFVYHSIAMQLVTFLGLTCGFCGSYVDLPELLIGGFCICSITGCGQTQFQILICVEHYLAVVHPITYRRLRHVGEVRIRHISSGCVWLLSFGWMILSYLSKYDLYLLMYYFTMGVVLIVISFCSISVLCVLKRPRPGEVGGNKKQADQSKKRAFYTIMAIFGVLLFRFMGNLIVNLIYRLAVVATFDYCVGFWSICWMDLPSNLVLPLLFLQRMGKLQCCR